ncbi:MAG: Fic family protein [Patescibacteria group bacterium]|nr:Fic family protein [Patescibacteria group bacterium]
MDTEVLIKYNEHADDKSEFDANMILNHKRAIEYMIQFKKDLPLTHQTVFELHSLLARDLIDNKYLGVIRNVRVDIGASTYTPLQTEQVLRVELDIFLEKLNQITNPFEQSIFILVFIPYFQLFFDVNKRVSRMLCNLPLLMNNLPLVSLLSIKKKTYIQALLSVYELNDTSLLCKIFVENYMKNAQRYI